MKKVRGVHTAIVTPFDAKGGLDEEGLVRNLHFQMHHGVDGIVALGTTGESPTLLPFERERIILRCVAETNGKTLLTVGTGSYSTQQTIEHTLQAEDLGADMALVVTPYYNKPTQEGLYRHFKAVSEAVGIPIIIYNIQGRTSQNLQTDTLKRLADLPNITGIKEASGNILQINEVMELIARHRPSFSVMSGDDCLTLSVMALGGDGVISVVSNLIPAQIKALVQAFDRGDYAAARDLHYQLMPLFRGAFIETNPIPIKAAMNLCGMAAGGCRLPLCELLPENAKKLHELLLKELNEKDLKGFMYR